MENRREHRRARRRKDGVCTVAIVGYTNAGKSTLLNTLTDAGVLAEDKLFATLDPTSRALKLPDGREVLLVDTVGFVRRLPHHLVKAFRSTLEEAVEADLILNICDASSPEAEEHLRSTASCWPSWGAPTGRSCRYSTSATRRRLCRRGKGAAHQRQNRGGAARAARSGGGRPTTRPAAGDAAASLLSGGAGRAVPAGRARWSGRNTCPTGFP